MIHVEQIIIWKYIHVGINHIVIIYKNWCKSLIFFISSIKHINIKFILKTSIMENNTSYWRAAFVITKLTWFERLDLEPKHGFYGWNKV